jgi:histidinol dehydrogenase
MKSFSIKNKISNKLNGLEQEDFYQFLTESQSCDSDIKNTVEGIITKVKNAGDAALLDYCNQFDRTHFTTSSDLLVSEKDIKNSSEILDKKIQDALKKAYKRITDYHEKQLPKDFNFKDKQGVELGNIWKSIQSIGVYVPGGTASYPSSVLMSAIPAIVAGVKDIVICAPTSAGKINPAILFAAHLCGIKTIYKIGGAQAIAALTYGTDTVQKVNKIVGPGNAYVATAKQIVSGEVGIDMIAGPTDLTIIADKSANPSWIAADILSQLEHGPDSKAFIVTNNETFATRTLAEISALSQNLKREDIVKESLKNSAIFIINDLDDAPHIVNFIAPEHLEIATNNPKKLLPAIENAGAIFLGHYTPEAIGDYMAGPSHTLPTSASAKFSSGLSVFDFLKRISLISCNKKSFMELAEATSILADCEGLGAHKLSVDIRNN